MFPAQRPRHRVRERRAYVEDPPARLRARGEPVTDRTGRGDRPGYRRREHRLPFHLPDERRRHDDDRHSGQRTYKRMRVYSAGMVGYDKRSPGRGRWEHKAQLGDRVAPVPEERLRRFCVAPVAAWLRA